jgi:hypothetical protein
MPKVSHSKQYYAPKNRRGAKDKDALKCHYTKLISRYEGYLAEMQAGNKTPGRKQKAAPATTLQTEATAGFKPPDSDKRVVIKFFFGRRDCPPKEDTDGHGGTIAEVRRDIGEGAPCIASERNTLLRLVEGDEDIAASSVWWQWSAAHPHRRR